MNKLRGFAQLIILNSLALASYSHAAGISGGCFYFEPSETLRNHRAHLLETLPEIAPLVRDPRAFLKDWENRFQEQKKITPDNPRLFDVMDTAESSLKFMSETSEKRLVVLEKALDRLEDPKRWHFGLWDWWKARKDPTYIPFGSRKHGISEVKDTIELLTKVKDEVDGYLDEGKIPYQKWIEMSHYYSRAIGRYQIYQNKIRDQILIHTDRPVQSYLPLSAREELDMYNNREFFLTQPSVLMHFAFHKENPIFERAFFNPEKLEFALYPIVNNPKYEGLEFLVPYNIFPVGITDGRLAADGYVRPGGDFENHDKRHGTLLFAIQNQYQQHYKVAPGSAKMERIAHFQNELDAELKLEMSKISDPHLKEALKFYFFHVHHKHGMPILPSTYAMGPLHRQYSQNFYLYLKLTDQKPSIGRKPWRKLQEAHDWANDFFMKRSQQELDILGAEKFGYYYYRTPFPGLEDVLDSRQLQTALKKAPGWRFSQGSVQKDFTFKNKYDTQNFVDIIKGLKSGLEQRVEVRTFGTKVIVSTHTPGNRAGLITKEDFEFAKVADDISEDIRWN